MHLGILIAVILYEVIVICGVSWVLNRRQEKLSAADMVSASGSMSTVAVAATMALTSLGGGHILGMPAQAGYTGVGTYWYILSSGMMLVILCCYVGPWYHRMRVNTVSEMFEKLYDRRVALILTGLTAGCTWGVITLEMQGVGTVLSAITGWPLIICCIVGGIISILYVVFAGMKEVAWVNVINAIVMYLGVIVAAIYLGFAIPGGWESVNSYYTSSGNDWMLSLWSNADTWKTYIIGTILGQLFFVPVNQAGCQCSVSAKNVKTLKKSGWLAIPLNCIFGIFMIAFGMAASTMSDYAGVYGGPMDTFMMLVDLLPGWVVVWLLAGFAAAILSTIAACVMGISTVFVNDIVMPRQKKTMSDATHIKWLRGTIVVISALACMVSTLLPSVNTSMVWLFSWLLPAFWMFVFGMHWKRSTRAAIATTIICAVVNCIWSFTDMATLLHMNGNNNSIVMLLFTMVVGAVAIALDKDAKPGLVSLYKKDKQLVISSKTL